MGQEDLDELSKTLRRKVLAGLRKKKFHMKRLDTLKTRQSSLTGRKWDKNEIQALESKNGYR